MNSGLFFPWSKSYLKRMTSFISGQTCKQKKEKISRLTSDKVLSNDRRGNLIQGLQPIFFSIWVQKQHTKVGFKHWPPESDAVSSTKAFTTRLSGPCHRISQNWFFEQALFRSEVTWNRSKVKKRCGKKSLEKSKVILEEKRTSGQAKNLHKKDLHVYKGFSCESN